ncbi:hypothetical protein BVRB_7g180650 [Beta vulgaris subsp. vulgaris]|uniref:Uncharacterized protein n=1 Tax=Beta vulgaris subsp. vulgaris TaxID=3555 RepID=A0A0J8B7B5_BETVV|nr:hypothetical protein BVRB_7g180650 [Beta vulgaris subsp. vulgaris]
MEWVTKLLFHLLLRNDHPQVKLVLVLAPGAVALGAKAWVFFYPLSKDGL